jgi:hypothetical protein
MRIALSAAVVTAAGMLALATPAGACPNGYHAVWIQGHKVCRVNTPNLPIKAKQLPEPSGKSPALRSR